MKFEGREKKTELEKEVVRHKCTLGRMTMEGRVEKWAIHSHISPIRLLRTAPCTRALRCAHSLARSLAPKLMGKRSMI